MDITLHWSLPLVFLGVTGLVLALAKLIPSPDGRVNDRIRNFQGISGGDRLAPREEAKPQSAPSPWKTILIQIATYLLPRKAEQRSRLHQDLIEAGYYSNAAPMKFLLAQAALAVLFAVIGLWGCQVLQISPTDSMIALLISGGIGYLVPGFWIRQRKARRLLMLRRSLPDFLDLMVTCLQAGMTIEAAIQRVSREIEPAHPLLAGELARVQHEIEIGATPDRALQNFGERTDCDTVRSLATVCHQSRKFGTKLASALRTPSDALRERREHDAEEAAQKAAVKILVPTLVCLFPCIFVILAGPAAIQILDEFGKTQETATSREGGVSSN